MTEVKLIHLESCYFPQELFPTVDLGSTSNLILKIISISGLIVVGKCLSRLC